MSFEKKVLCSIEVVKKATKVPNTDKLFSLSILGYDVLVNREDFAEDFSDLKGIYFHIDAILPESLNYLSIYDKLKNSWMGKRVQTIKIRNCISQGLFLPLNSIKNLPSEEEGTDLTEFLNIKKYYDPNDLDYSGCVNSTKPFHSLIPKTEQIHLQKCKYFLKDSAERKFVVSLKIDGQSSTYYYINNNFGICSRNYELLEKNKGNIQYFFIAEKYNIKEKLVEFFKQTGRSLAIQGEIYGSNINGNRLKMNGLFWRVFDIYDIEKKSYLPYSEVKTLSEKFDFPIVPLVLEESVLENTDLSFWLDKVSKLTYDSLSPEKGLLAEGVVIKSSDNLFPYLSCKVISKEYLIKHKL